MTPHQLINQTSGKVEYYTPRPIIEAARAVMRSITLDPATSVAANQNVRAISFFTEDDGGLHRDWFGHVWMNHPFRRDLNAAWIQKLEMEFESGRVTQACCITFACTSEKWFQPLLRRPQCFLSPRTNYHLPDGSLLRGVTKGSVVTYYGENVESFKIEFAKLGVVKI